jgi:hypothetical protein
MTGLGNLIPGPVFFLLFDKKSEILKTNQYTWIDSHESRFNASNLFLFR